MLMYRNTHCRCFSLERGRTFVKGKPIPLRKYTPMRTHTQKLLVSLHLRASDPHRAMCRMRPTFRTRRRIINPLRAVQRAEVPAHLSSHCHHCCQSSHTKHIHYTCWLLMAFLAPVFDFPCSHNYTQTHTCTLHSHSHRTHGVCRYQSGFLGY